MTPVLTVEIRMDLLFVMFCVLFVMFCLWNIWQ